jgi:hypothetical protein
MDKAARMDWDNLHSPDGETRYQAFMRLLETTERPVDWAYVVLSLPRFQREAAMAFHRKGLFFVAPRRRSGALQ